ncbi:hypothetical protein LEL_10923 [Akanthomyces lecanii RCEF 1005]|uniref:Uncharacterized protein n=1 Tax=Akanthomyces lecanii RCEF 1005 TaxID=1081108 RepID=A0A167Q6P4_CORDF|nr:hypothetical protein LEL_10923 [Akanthomyces lecanii RCEF 1005]
MNVPNQHDPIATAVTRKQGRKLLRLSAKLASRTQDFVARAAYMSVPYQQDREETAAASKRRPTLRRMEKEPASRAHVSVARAANMKVPSKHDRIATAVALKCGPHLLRTNDRLANRAHVFAASVYWVPVHKRYRVAAQLPKGETAPDLNKLVSIPRVVALRRRDCEPSLLTGCKVADTLAERLSSEHAEHAEHAEPVLGLSQESLASSPNNDSDSLRGQDNEMR